MVYLESFIHRARLAEIITRWVVNKPRFEDAMALKEIINLNSYSARIWVDQMATTLLTELIGQPPQSFLCKNKGQLKDFLAQSPQRRNVRIDDLISRYQRYPEDYFCESPFDGRVYYSDGPEGGQYIGSTRIKRFRRIAEKGSRQIVDYMLARIRDNADALAEDRAKKMGIAKHQLITSEEEQIAEFMRAERRLLQTIQGGTIQKDFPVLSIPDVVGVKLIAEGAQYEKLLAIIDRREDCRLVEVEHHTGRYNATNLRVAYKIPYALLKERLPHDDILAVFAYRGFAVDTVVPRYLEFLSTGEPEVMFEIIVSDYEEFLESEIGRSMHEERIFEQRTLRDYHSNLATNVLYLMHIMLSFCLSPHPGPILDVPIKLWVKYLPDTLDRIIRRMFGIPVDASFDNIGGPVEQGWSPRMITPAIKES